MFSCSLNLKIMPRVKNTGSVKPKTDVSIGVHLFIIESIKWARDSKGHQVANDSGEMAIDIKFNDEKNRSLIHRFWLTDKAMWVLDNLRKAVGVYKEHQQTHVNEIIGKKCYGIVAAKFYFTEDGLRREADGFPYLIKELLPKFFPVVQDIRPKFSGDPMDNAGIPSGDFLLNKGIELKEFFTSADQDWMIKQLDTVHLMPHQPTPKAAYKAAKTEKVTQLLDDDF